jgi:DNA repair exonuclease SbcCD ATPase subunit
MNYKKKYLKYKSKYLNVKKMYGSGDVEPTYKLQLLKEQEALEKEIEELEEQIKDIWEGQTNEEDNQDFGFEKNPYDNNDIDMIKQVIKQKKNKIKEIEKEIEEIEKIEKEIEKIKKKK